MSYSEKGRRKQLREHGIDDETIETIIKQDEGMERHFNNLECLMCGGVVVREKNESPPATLPFGLEPDHSWFRYQCQGYGHTINRQEIDTVH